MNSASAAGRGLPITPEVRRGLALAAVASFATALFCSGPVAGIGGLYEADRMANPYWVPSLAWLLYGVAPLYAAAASVMIVAPGVAVLLRLERRESTWPSIVVRAFLVAYALRFAFHSLVKLLTGRLTPTGFWIVEAGLLIGVLYLLWSTGRGPSIQPAESPKSEGRARQLWLVPILSAITMVLLLPALFWQDLNGDGVETLYMGWTMGQHVLPRFIGGSGFLGLGAGMSAMAAPVAWFVQMLGPTDAAARMVIPLYMPLMAFVLIALIEHGRAPLANGPRLAVLIMLAAYTCAMVYSATYSDYVPDAAAPAGLEMLTLLCLAGAVLSLWDDRRAGFLSFVGIGFLARPTALMWVALLAVGAVVAMNGDDRKRMLRDVTLALGVCLALLVLFEKILLAWLSDGEMGYPSSSMLERYQYLRFADVRRFLWAAVPGGIVGFASLVLLKLHDRLSRQLAVVLLLYFVAFFFPAFVALHHFAPVMVLPIVVYLRSFTSRRATGIAIAGAVLGLLLVWPQTFALQRPNRELGARMEFRGLDLLEDSPDHRQSLQLLSAELVLFPASWDVPDPATRRIGSGLALAYYAATSNSEPADIDYVLTFEGARGPDGFEIVGSTANVVAYARSFAILERDRTSPPTTEFGAPLFRIGRETLFEFIGARDGAFDIDLRRSPVIWRLFPGN